ncbi:hypothetical protein ACVBEJ_03405 [Porticoccus sp. GXU_MW_L64]
MKNFFAVFFCLLAVNQLALADIPLSENTTVVFASKKQAAKLLGQKDAYSERLSRFDLTAKMQRKKPATKKQFLTFASKQGMAWSEQEQQTISDVFNSFRHSIAPYSKFLPEKIHLVKTTGRVESAAFYVRGNSIHVPVQQMVLPEDKLKTVMLHNLFHIIASNNPELRDRLYAAIGFVKTNELVLPDGLKEREINNPDVPILSHLIKITVDGQEHWATPVIYSETDYNRAVKRIFFQYLNVGMLVYNWDGKSDPVAAIKDGAPFFAPADQITGLYEQIGRNTKYLFHAEEVLADNFALLVQGHRVASPEVLERMRQAFQAAKSGF